MSRIDVEDRRRYQQQQQQQQQRNQGTSSRGVTEARFRRLMGHREEEVPPQQQQQPQPQPQRPSPSNNHHHRLLTEPPSLVDMDTEEFEEEESSHHRGESILHTRPTNPRSNETEYNNNYGRFSDLRNSGTLRGSLTNTSLRIIHRQSSTGGSANNGDMSSHSPGSLYSRAIYNLSTQPESSSGYAQEEDEYVEFYPPTSRDYEWMGRSIESLILGHQTAAPILALHESLDEEAEWFDCTSYRRRSTASTFGGARRRSSAGSFPGGRRGSLSLSGNLHGGTLANYYSQSRRRALQQQMGNDYDRSYVSFEHRRSSISSSNQPMNRRRSSTASSSLHSLESQQVSEPQPMLPMLVPTIVRLLLPAIANWGPALSCPLWPVKRLGNPAFAGAFHPPTPYVSQGVPRSFRNWINRPPAWPRKWHSWRLPLKPAIGQKHRLSYQEFRHG